LAYFLSQMPYLKAKLSLRALETCWGKGLMAPIIINLGIRGKCEASRSGLLTPQKSLSLPVYKEADWVNRVDMGVWEKRKVFCSCWESKHNFSVTMVLIPTELSLPQCRQMRNSFLYCSLESYDNVCFGGVFRNVCRHILKRSSWLISRTSVRDCKKFCTTGLQYEPSHTWRVCAPYYLHSSTLSSSEFLKVWYSGFTPYNITSDV
jgi:hypothetical protein